MFEAFFRANKKGPNNRFTGGFSYKNPQICIFPPFPLHFIQACKGLFKNPKMAKFPAISSPVAFFRQSRDELKKVTWPSRQTTIRYTIVVLVGSLAVGLLAGGLDYVYTKLLQLIIS